MKFIKKHALWTDEQTELAKDLAKAVTAQDLHLVRLVWSDTHGSARAKALTIPAFLDALVNGYNVNVATTTLDASGGRVFSSFTPGGGMGLDEMTGSPNLTLVPDPQTFRVLPWAPGVAWIICDQYFNSGMPFHFAPRQLLRRQLARLNERNMSYIIGLEVEWYLARIVDDHLGAENIGWPGTRGKPVETAPPEPGYTYHSETNMDIMQPVLSELAIAFEKLNLPLRSLENEWGPGQIECTFTAQDALTAADNFVLFRTATRQICRRMGYFATFMAKPGIKGYYASGWHLHQSIIDTSSGKNLFMPASDAHALSPLGLNFLGGVVEHAVPMTVFATPTINGYRRFKPNSLAPDRACWGIDHRGVMVRVIGGQGDSATRLENRLGEPSANPYLFCASQIAAGLDGVERTTDPGSPQDDPYSADRPALPASLAEALDAVKKDKLARAQFGDVFIDYFVKFKQAEITRFETYCTDNNIANPHEKITQWEQNEYFDFF